MSMATRPDKFMDRRNGRNKRDWQQHPNIEKDDARSFGFLYSAMVIGKLTSVIPEYFCHWRSGSKGVVWILAPDLISR